MAHTDTVGVQREKWTHPPFSATLSDGFIYGRGTIDDKDNLAAGLMAMLLLKRQNVALDRDIIFLAEAGEEGTPSVGVQFMVEEHWPEIEAEYCLAEGGGTYNRGGKLSRMLIATTEKTPYTSPGGGAWHRGTRLPAAAGQRHRAARQRGLADRRMDPAHAAERHDAGVLRTPRHHLDAGGSGAVQRHHQSRPQRGDPGVFPAEGNHALVDAADLDLARP